MHAKKMAMIATGTQRRGILMPLERSAVISFSADIRPKTSRTAVRKPHGIVNVSENGTTYAMIVKMRLGGGLLN